MSSKSNIKGPSLNSLRENSSQNFKNVMKTFAIDETFTKSDTKQKKYNKFITAVVPEEDWNYMSDLIELPTTSKGFKWLLVVLDLASNKFDIEPMKNKTANTTLDSFKNIIKRKILTLPEISLKTDGGTEYKSVFNQYLIDHKIFHKTAMAYHKKQMAPVEGLNRTIGRILMNYLNGKSLEIKKDYNEWTDILPQLRQELNNYRKRDLSKLKEYQSKRYFDPNVAGEPEYNIGDYVYYRLAKPTDILGKPLSDSKHREGDRIYSQETREIVDILMYPSAPYYRYKLESMPNVSYSYYDLKPSEKDDNYYLVKKIIGVKVVNKKKYYLVFWKNTLKKDSTWELADQLIEDGLTDEIQAYEKESRKKARK